MWANPAKLEALERRGQPRASRFPELQGANSADGPYAALYRLHQLEEYGERGVIDPIWIW